MDEYDSQQIRTKVALTKNQQNTLTDFCTAGGNPQFQYNLWKSLL
jgi:hypothetical protein